MVKMQRKIVRRYNTTRSNWCLPLVAEYGHGTLDATMKIPVLAEK